MYGVYKDDVVCVVVWISDPNYLTFHIAVDSALGLFCVEVHHPTLLSFHCFLRCLLLFVAFVVCVCFSALIGCVWPLWRYLHIPNQFVMEFYLK